MSAIEKKIGIAGLNDDTRVVLTKKNAEIAGTKRSTTCGEIRKALEAKKSKTKTQNK